MRSYLKLAWRVLWRRRFVTLISLFGICFTLVVLMVAAVAWVVIVAQFPLLDLIAAIGPGVYAAGLLISAPCICLFGIARAWAPSRLATSLPLAEALRYE